MTTTITVALVPFCVVDVHGQVVMHGTSADLPQIEGMVTLPEHAPDGCYRSGDTWLSIPPAPSMHHSFDWASHTWVDRTLDQVRAAKLLEINAAFRLASSALIAGYPAEERQTWAAQESDALAWAADPSAATPYLDGIAAARGITPADMRTKTLEAVQAFRSASQWLVGTRQALRDAIQSPTATREQIESLAWPASPPQE